MQALNRLSAVLFAFMAAVLASVGASILIAIALINNQILPLLGAIGLTVWILFAGFSITRWSWDSVMPTPWVVASLAAALCWWAYDTFSRDVYLKLEWVLIELSRVLF